MSEENHCKDCCCAQSWAALGIAEYTGKSIPEHIAELRKERDMFHERLVFQDRWLSGGIYYTNGEITQLYEDHRRELEFMYKKGQMDMRERAAKVSVLGCPTSEEEATKRYGANWRTEQIRSLPIEDAKSSFSR